MPKHRPTKISRVRTMLERPSGATLAAICKATGWQPHSARAALSGLRKAGHTIERDPGATDTPSVYRIVAPREATS